MTASEPVVKVDPRNCHHRLRDLPHARDETAVELKDDRLAWFFGFGAGVLGGAYGMNGPPLVAYAAMRRWSPERFRATLQGYFLPASAVGMAGYWMAGLWSSAVTRYYLVSLPVVLVAIVLGRLLNRRIDKGRFLFYVHIWPGCDRDDPPGSIRLGARPEPERPHRGGKSSRRRS